MRRVMKVSGDESKTGFRMSVAAAALQDSRSRFALHMFALYCADRIERELGPAAWSVSLKSCPAGFTCVVRAARSGRRVEIAGVGAQPSIALWNAMCCIEQPLREGLAAA